MGELPQNTSITIEFESQFRVTLTSSDFAAIMKAFLLLLPQFLEDFFQKVLVGFAEYAMALPQKPFVCTCCGNDTDFVRKTRHGKATTILTLGYGDVLENLTNTILSATTLPCPALLALTFQTSFST